MSANLDYDTRITAPESQASGRPGAVSDNPGVVPAAAGDFDARPGRVTALDRWLGRKLLEMLLDPPFDIRLWGGQSVAQPVPKSLRVSSSIRVVQVHRSNRPASRLSSLSSLLPSSQ